MRLLAAALALHLAASPAAAAGLRPLGADWEGGRLVGPGNFAIEAGAWAPAFLDPATLDPTEEDLDVLGRYMALPAWPELRVLYGLPDGNEALVSLGSAVTASYRKPFLDASAPWEGERLAAIIQAGVGFHLAALRPLGYLRLPAYYDRGPLSFHLAPGGYYAFNQQPVVSVPLGMEWHLFGGLSVGATAHLRMDAKQLTPTEGAWSFGGGARYRLGKWGLQVDYTQENGPPAPSGTRLEPRVEFPHDGLRATAFVYW